MKIILALDDNNGMMFNKRRQSQDAAVREKIKELTKDGKLWMNDYSGRQFADMELDFYADEDFLSKAGPGEYCFVENMGILAVAGRVEEFIIFRWNRKYPGDFYPDLLPWEHGFTCSGSEEFQGRSHEKITMEVWSKEKCCIL